MAKFTLFEIHLDDATLTANTPFGGEGESAGSDAGDDLATDDSGEGSGPPVVALAVGLVVLLVLAAVLRRLIGGGDGEIGDDEPA